MKIDRRCFLSLGIGAGAGVALTPIPWKMTDDSAIWTQMWPWTPVPKDGAVTQVDSVCTLCSAGCGIRIRKVNKRAIKIEGQPGSPGSNGNACILGLSGLQLLYGPNRIKGPLKREGVRGNSQWKSISWEAAIAELAEKINGIIKTKGGSSIACITNSDQGILANMFRRFTNACGSPNYFAMPSIEDAYDTTMHLMHGTRARVGFDFENSNYVLSFGSGVLDGWGPSVQMFKTRSAWKDHKVKFVQVEPRLSNTAAKADQWIAIQPGTEVALALGMAHVIIKESLHHQNFIKRYAFGFHDWVDQDGKKHQGFKQLVEKEYSPAQVQTITGIPAQTIATLAKEFAGASNSVAICGRGAGNTPGGQQEFMAVHALNALTGNINKPGGIWVLPADDCSFRSPLKKCAENQDRVDGAGKDYPAQYLLTRLPQIINKAKKSPIQALLTADANPLYNLPDVKEVRKAFNKIPLIVSFASHWNETAAHADLILPQHSYLERYEDVRTPMGAVHSRIGLAKPVVKPLLNTRHSGDVLIQLAQKMGLTKTFPWKTYQAALTAKLGKDWKDLQQKSFIVKKSMPPAWDRAFQTTFKKFEFIPGAFKSQELFKPLVMKGKGKVTLIPYDSMRLAAGKTSNTPFLTKTVEDTVLKNDVVFIEINPKTARSLGLKQGCAVRLSTVYGTAKVRINLFDGIMPGIVALPRGLGHTGIDPYLAGKGVNINELMGPLTDPVSGLNAAWGIKAKLEKA